MSQQPKNPEILKELIEHECQLDWAFLSLEELNAELESYRIDDSRRPRIMAILLQTRYKLARQYTDLAIMKAQLGIVGNSWHDPKKKL